MLNITEIKNAFLGLVGFSDDMSAHTQKLQASLKRSLSGTYFQDAHPLITLQVLEEIAPRNLSLDRFAEVVNGSAYNVGDIVKSADKIYMAIADTVYTGVFDANWEETNLFSIWLLSKVQATIVKVVQTVLSNSAIDLDAKHTLTEDVLFTGAGYIKDVIPNSNNLVGLIVEPRFMNGISLKINRIGLQSTVPGDLMLYIFHSSSNLPVKIVKLVKTKFDTFEWTNTDDLVLTNYDYAPNGYWIFAYNQNDLEALGSQAIKNTVNLRQLCSTCRHTAGLQSFIDVLAFKTDNTGFSNTLWEQNNNLYYTDTNFGLNLDISAVCDFTSIFINHKTDFINLVKLQFAVDMLREFVYNANARVNRTAAIASRADVLYALDGDTSKFSRRSGLSYDLERAYNAFEINTKGLNTRCLPCKRNGVKYKTML